ncbi:DUF4404 family protein [Porticoccaceae bacterium LTM1]|nr:DUF4404 family protein [Porticoccaceae bacterium LTM1]
MTSEDLKTQIQELRQQLEYASKTDSHVKDMFGSLMEDIVVLATQGPEEVDAEGVKDQLEQRATDFENRHPRIASLMRQLMDLLAKMGI